MEIYLDNGATTKPCKAAIDAALECMTDNYGNPSSLHAAGLKAELAMKEARAIIAKELGCIPECLYFTSGATESNNTAISGIAGTYGKRLPKIVTTSVEHASVRAALKELSENGFEIVYVSPDENGEITPESIVNAVDNKTCLVSMMLVNNETGYILPVRKAFNAIKKKYPKCITHCDAVQGFMKLPFKVETLAADIVSISAHKIHGCKGIGGLYVKKGVRLKSLMYGGEQEKKLRPGTENVPMAAAFGAAVKSLSGTTETRLEAVKGLREHFCQSIRDIDGIVINSIEKGSPYIINISVPYIRSEIMLHFLESKGIYVSSGSACSKGAKSGVLEEFGVNSALADCAIRISLCPENTKEELTETVKAIKEGMERLVHNSPGKGNRINKNGGQ